MTIEWQPYSRRAFVAGGLTGLAGTGLIGAPITSAAVRRLLPASDVAFNSGVASGQVAQREITLWTQVDGLQAGAKLTVEVATDPAFSRIKRRGQVYVSPESGTARIRVANRKSNGELVPKSRRLEPGEQYYYRFFSKADNASSPVGRFRTALPPGSNEPVKIAFLSCQDFISGYYVAHRDLLAQDVDLVVSLGDYIYEQAFFAGGIREVPETPDGTVRTLDEYRNQYRAYHADQYLRDVRAMAPMAVIWDDHEVQDNYAADKPGHEWVELSGVPQRQDIPFMQRRANAYKAFFEAHPIIRNAAEPDRTYAAHRTGQVELFRLDARQYKTDQVCNPEDGPFAWCADQRDALNPNGTMIGQTQRNWLLNGLKNSKARWKLIANQVMMMSNDLLPGYTFDTEGWDGYAAERAMLCDWVTSNAIKNVVVLTGDVHMFYAGHVTRTGRDASVPFAGLTPGGPVMPEFVVGAMTSQGISDRVSGELFNLGYNIEKYFNPNAVRQSDEALRNGIAELVDGFLGSMNPHWKYANSSYKGYALVECRSDAMKVKFRAVHDVKFQNTSPFTLASFTVQNGSPVLQRDATASQSRRTKLPVDRSIRLTDDQIRDYILKYASH